MSLPDNNEPEVHGPEKWCATFRAWAGALIDGGDDRLKDAMAIVENRLCKSSLGRRLFYGGEALRTEKCPRHNGRWSGLYFEPPSDGCRCYEGNCGEATGWIPAKVIPHARGEEKS